MKYIILAATLLFSANLFARSYTAQAVVLYAQSEDELLSKVEAFVNEVNNTENYLTELHRDECNLTPSEANDRDTDYMERYVYEVKYDFNRGQSPLDGFEPRSPLAVIKVACKG